MVDQIPPAYSTRADKNSNVLPPTYTAPTQFDIGSQRTSEPLVNISKVKGHLALLHAFANLKKQVEGLQEPIPHMPLNLEKRWAWFVALAVERFDIWCQGLQPSDAEKSLELTLPPIDVMMVWHAYMLNPMWYTEDCTRLPACQALNAIGTRFATSLDGRLQSILSTPPSESRVEFWHTKTTLPFDHVESSYKLINKTIHCPLCRADVVVDIMTPTGSGYLQHKFIKFCPQGCTLAITKQMLALRKLAQDLASISESSLAGTLFNPSSPSAPAIGKAIKFQVYNSAKVSISTSQSSLYDENSCVNIVNYAKTSPAKLKDEIFASQSDASRRLITRIMSAYVDDKPYSVELVGAVLRQGSFVKKMYELGWTGPGFFDDAGDELALQHAICRYHAFLDLMASSPASFFVPTLDIDLVWHTHQLMSDKYKSDCTKYVSRFVDHDDKVEGLQLSSAFDITCRAWKNRFFVKYSHCGCPIPGDTIGKKLVRLAFGARRPIPPSHLLPFNRPDLLSATHASDHNAVHFQSGDSRAHILAKARYANLARKKKHEAQKVTVNAANANVARWRLASTPVLHPPHAPRSQTAGTNLTSRTPMYAYDTPFLVPVPIYFTAGLAFGGGTAGCVAPDGQVIDPSGSCRSGGGWGCGGAAGGDDLPSRVACGGGAGVGGDGGNDGGGDGGGGEGSGGDGGGGGGGDCGGGCGGGCGGCGGCGG